MQRDRKSGSVKTPQPVFLTPLQLCLVEEEDGWTVPGLRGKNEQVTRGNQPSGKSGRACNMEFRREILAND